MPIAYLGELTLLLIQTFSFIFQRAVNLRLTVQQMALIGVNSLPIVLLTTAFTGMVISLQVAHEAVRFGGGKLVGGLVAVAMARELAPVLTGVVVAGRAGSAICAELGSMKVSEQIDAMEVSSTNPINFLVVTRVVAATLMIPLLVFYADAFSMLGSWLGSNIKGDISFVLFSSQAFSHITFLDFLPAIIKSFFFGSVIGLVGCYKGYNAGRGTASVGVAANSAVVVSSLLVIIVDLIAVQITDLIVL